MARHRNHHKRRLTNVPDPAGIILSCNSHILAHVSRKPLPPLIQVELAEPDGPNESFGDPCRRGHQNCPRRWKRGGIRNGHRTRGQSSRRGTTSRRRVMSTTSSPSPGCWASDELLVSIFAGTLCSAYFGMDTILAIYSNAQYMFGVQHHHGNTLVAAFTHRYPQHSRHRVWHATKMPPVFARLESAHSVLHPTAGSTDHIGVWFMVPHRALRKGQSTKTNLSDVSILLDWK